MRNTKFIAFVVGALLCFADVARAQDYPNRAVRFIVPAAAGLGTDVFARLFANELQTILKTPIIIENRPGAGGEIGANEAVRAAPDGYTLFLSSSSVIAANKWIYERTFDSEKDFVPIISVASTPLALLAGPSLKGKTLKDIIELARNAPKPFAIGAAATVNSLAYGMFREATGLDLLLVPYRQNQQAYVDLMGGNLQLMFDGVPPATPFLTGGQVVGLAVTSEKRSPFVPDIPTFQENGLNVVLSTWSGLLGPKGLPPDIVKLLNRAGNEALRSAELRMKLNAIGAEPMGGTPEEFGRIVKRDTETWGPIIKRFDLK